MSRASATRRIEDYALIGDCHTAALVGLDGSIDWLCWPRFDSDACLAALVGDASHGRWKLAPKDPGAHVTRRYLPDTMILETTFETKEGTVAVIDFMPPLSETRELIRLVVGKRGRVAMRMELILRFGYGAAVPWVTRLPDGALSAVCGPDMVVLRTPAATRGEGLTTVAEYRIRAGEALPFLLSYGPSHLPPPAASDAAGALKSAEDFWSAWSSACTVEGPHAEAMRRSLITLKALTYAPTGGIIAAPTTSLPEHPGGRRNWDYRYCWLRDSSLSLLALVNAGHVEEAEAWAQWLHRAVAGSPADLQVMYGPAGERRLSEWTADWLPGFAGSRPVRIGNAAYGQCQLDVYGEVMDAFHQARKAGLVGAETWDVQSAIVGHVSEVWREPDEGIWETRDGRRHFTFSKVMVWVALDRAVQAVEHFGLKGPVAKWRKLRARIHADVCRHGFNRKSGGFQRAYDDRRADASLLLLAEVGFIGADDPRFAATVAAVERELITDSGLVMRYDTRHVDDGLPPGEGAFLACSFWLANAYALLGRGDEAARLFDRLLALRNDIGLLAEEYDPRSARMVGNFPQAYSHLALLGTAMNLTHALKPSEQRAGRGS